MVLFECFDWFVGEYELVVVVGSLLCGVELEWLGELLWCLWCFGLKVVFDSSGVVLCEGVKVVLWMIKLNVEELVDFCLVLMDDLVV